MVARATTLSNRRAAIGAVILVMAFIASRALGLVREMVIAYYFGTSVSLDAYLAAFRLPDLIFQMLASGAFGSAFIPIFVSYMSRGHSHDAWRIASSAINLITSVSIVLAILTALTAPLLVPLLVPGFTPEQQALTISLTRILLLSPVLFGISIIISAVLNARQHFLLPAIAPLVYNLAIIGGAALSSSGGGIYTLAYGVVAGSALHLLIQVPALVRYGVVYRLGIYVDHPGVRQVARLLVPRAIGLAAAQVAFFVQAFIASGLAPGSLAAVSWAWQLTMLPLGVFGMSIAQAVFPTLADQAALDQRDALRRTIAGSLRIILFLLIPASVGLIVLREPLVALLLERGQFTESSTSLTAWALMFFAMGLFAHGMVEILTRGFYALHDTITPVSIAVLAMIINLVASPLLVGPFAHGGLGLAMSIAVTVEAAALLALLRARIGDLDDTRLIAGMVKSLVASMVMGAAIGLLWYGPERLTGDSAGRSPLGVVAIIGVGGVIYLAAAWGLRSPEVGELLGLVRRVAGRRSG